MRATPENTVHTISGIGEHGWSVAKSHTTPTTKLTTAAPPDFFRHQNSAIALKR
jgi:hypothetical protein